MRNFLFLILISVFIILIQKVSAEPIISDVSLQPMNVWFNENISISLDCYDPTGNITKVYGKITDPVFSENLKFDAGINNRYMLTLTNLYFDPSKPPKYTFLISCQNEINQTTNTSITFDVSQIKVNISSITTTAYLGDFIEMGVSIEKDGSPLYSEDISFNLKLGGQVWPKTSFYDPTKNYWVIKFNVPGVLGTYDLDLEVNVNLPGYSSKKFTLKSSIEVKDAIDFRVLSVDKTEVNTDDIITVSLSASEKDNKIMLSKDYLNFQVGSTTIDPGKIEISSAGSYFKVKIQMPNLSPDTYDLKITLNYINYSITRTIGVDYVLPISGKFIDLSNKGINVEIKFLIGDTEKKKLVADSSGSYSGYIVPGNYTIQIISPQSTLYLYGAKISDFNDPIKYYFLDSDVAGIKSAGLFIYEVALSYTKAKVILNYDDKKLSSEKNLLVYRCDEWNSQNKICNNNWAEQDAIIDTIRNTVTIERSDLSAFVVGVKKYLYIDFSSEKNAFGLKEPIKLRGVTRDESGNFVQDVSLKARVNEVDINTSTYSISNGVFTLEFLSPEEDGFYNLIVRAEKSPYTGYDKTWSFQVMKNRKISLIVPETIRIKKGENQTLQFSVINIGQSDLSDLILSLTGLPRDYFTLQNKIDELKVGQELKVPINFKIPKDASESTLSITFNVSSNEISTEEIIGFTIFSENETKSVTSEQKILPTFKFPTAQISLPVSLNDIGYAVVFCVLCVLIVYFLKRNKLGVKERKNVKNLLLDIKNEIKREKFAQSVSTLNQTEKKYKNEDK